MNNFNYLQDSIYFKVDINGNMNFWVEFILFVKKEKLGYMLSDYRFGRGLVEIRVSKKDANYLLLVFSDKFKKSNILEKTFSC